MKYCPYCGTVLIDGAVSFCAECGKKLPVSGKTEETLEKSNQSEQQEKSKPQQQLHHEKKSRRTQKGKMLHGETVKERKEDKADEEPIKPSEAPKRLKQQPEPPVETSADFIPEDDYDGYYDDILPADEGRFSEGIDRGLINKVVLIIGMVLLIVGACVMMMYLL